MSFTSYLFVPVILILVIRTNNAPCHWTCKSESSASSLSNYHHHHHLHIIYKSSGLIFTAEINYLSQWSHTIVTFVKQTEIAAQQQLWTIAGCLATSLKVNVSHADDYHLKTVNVITLTKKVDFTVFTCTAMLKGLEFQKTTPSRPVEIYIAINIILLV